MARVETFEDAQREIERLENRLRLRKPLFADGANPSIVLPDPGAWWIEFAGGDLDVTGAATVSDSPAVIAVPGGTRIAISGDGLIRAEFTA